MSISDLLKFGGKRPDETAPGAPATRLRPKGRSPSSRRRRSEVHQRALAPRGARCSSTSARSSAPTSRSSASISAASCFIEDLATEIDKHTRAQHARRAARRRWPSASRRPTRSVDGVLCWDIFDFLEPRRREGARARGGARAASRRRGDGLLLHEGRSSARRSPSTKSSRSPRRCGTAIIPAPAAPKFVLQNRDIIKMFDGLFVSESFLLKSNTREILLRKARLTCGPLIALLTDFGTQRSLRRDDEGRDPRDLPGRDARRHHATTSRRTT